MLGVGDDSRQQWVLQFALECVTQVGYLHGKATWTKVLKTLPGYEFRHEGTTNVEVRLAPAK